MRRMVLVVSLVLMGMAVGSARAQTEECPEDVGAALAAACPCDGAPGNAWKNHGGYVSCVVRFRNDLRKDGCLDREARRTIAHCAARSTCGKEGAVLCCYYDTSGTCNDVLPGDGTAEGVCSNDETLVCDTETDCVTVGEPKVRRHEETCLEQGGTPLDGGGSVCVGCPALPPAP